MARARNIKPGFFRNADLAELPVEARLLFIGLWTMADRAGRMEDRPKQIKMELMPADSVDFDALLGQLESIGMIQRYEVDGKRYLYVVNFAKHQNPHRDEKASTLPAPCEHGANTVPIVLNPDSGFLNPDSLIPDSSVAKATGAKAPLTPDEIIFGYGVPLLTSAGVAEKQARSFLGGLRKQNGDDALVDALRECIRAKPLQPLEWLAKALPPSGKSARKSFTEKQADRIAEFTGSNIIEGGANVIAISGY